jgi:hypothetical protein
MKSFSQFLYEAYLNEEDAEQLRLFKRDNKSTYNFRKNIGNRGISADPTPTPASKRLPTGATSDAPKTSPGQLELSLNGQKSGTTPVKPPGTPPTPTQATASQARQGSLLTKSGKAQNFTGGRTPFVGTEPVKATKRLPAAPPEAPKTSPGQQVIRQGSNPPTTKALPPGQKGGNLSSPTRSIPDAMMQGALDAANKPTGTSRPSNPTIPNRMPGESRADLAKTATDTSGKGGKFSKWGGRALGALGVALDTADEYKRQRELGRSKASSLGMGLAKAGGGLAAGEAGAAGGAALGGAIGSVLPGPGTLIGAGIGGIAGGIGGYMAGSGLAGKASHAVAGAAPKEKAAMAQANRQRQAGSALKGIGGKTTFSQKKPGGPAFMSTGVGSQRKTVQLAKTGEVQRDGKSTTGYLAFKGGKAVYKAGPSAQTLAQTSSNPLERIGRSLFAGAYKQHDIQKQQQALQKARESDIARGRALGLKYGPGR